ncbi:MAG: metal-sensitive transcriptional regulator [Verrucomicrobia bacterium]|nr:metal-sensitive transcriptional regulator [Verrucomicrobiota bacterium]
MTKIQIAQRRHSKHADALPRLARIEGQIRGIRRMIESGVYCIDILTQIRAARAALASVSRGVFQRHVEHCVAHAMRSRKRGEIDPKIREIMYVFRREMR